MHTVTFSERDKIKFSDQEQVPILVKGDHTVSASRQIAKYLESKYLDAPSLKLENGGLLFVKFYAETLMNPVLVKFLLLDIHDKLTAKEKIYFRESGEKIFGKTLEEIVRSREERLLDFHKILITSRLALKKAICG